MTIDQFSKLQLIVITYSPGLILTQKHTHISSHEIQAVFTLIRKLVKEKDRPREPRRGANVMPGK
jgi:ATP/maltotriose-dependent transcriptional regulator MalT